MIRGKRLGWVIILLLLQITGCRAIGREDPLPVDPTRAIPTRQPVSRDPSIPTPPPGATLTALVRAFRLSQTPTPALLSANTKAPKVTLTPTQIIITPTPTDGPLPSIYIVPETAEPGDLVEVRGTGWVGGESVMVSLGSTATGGSLTGVEGTARTNGTFAATLAVPKDWSAEDAIVIAQSLDGCVTFLDFL